MTQYGTIITNIGLAQIANAQVTQQKVGLEHIALGDGNGSYYIPTANQSALVNEVWRGPVSNVTIDPANDNRIIIEGLIPTTAGGFTIREIAVFDDQNQLIAVGQYPEKYKPQLSEGVAEETLIQFVIETNNADAVELSIDPTIIIASREYVDEKVATVSAGLVQLEEDFTTHLDKDATLEQKGHVQLSNTVVNEQNKALTPKAVNDLAWQRYKLTSDIGIPLTYVNDVNLNTYTDTGMYRVGVNSISGSSVAQGTYLLFVQRNTAVENSAIVQTLIAENGTQGALHIRSRNAAGTWGNWRSYVSNILNWIEATPQNGWQQQVESNRRLRFGKDDLGFVHIDGEVLGGTITNDTIITTLPTGFRPSSARPVPVIRADNGANLNAQLFQDGTLRIYNLSATGTLRFNGSAYVGV